MPLLHLRPQFFSQTAKGKLIEFSIEKLGLHLRDKKDLATGQPYPNESYWVGYRRNRQRAYAGILIETKAHIEEFETVARWEVDGHRIVTHRISYRLIDTKYDAVKDDDYLWFRYPLSTNQERRPWPSDLIHSPLYMQEIPNPAYQGEFTDVTDNEGRLVERRQIFRMPTLASGLMYCGNFGDIVPPLKHAFIAV